MGGAPGKELEEKGLEETNNKKETAVGILLVGSKGVGKTTILSEFVFFCFVFVVVGFALLFMFLLETFP